MKLQEMATALKENTYFVFWPVGEISVCRAREKTSGTQGRESLVNLKKWQVNHHWFHIRIASKFLVGFSGLHWESTSVNTQNWHALRIVSCFSVDHR